MQEKFENLVVKIAWVALAAASLFLIFYIIDVSFAQPPAGAWQGCGNTNGGGWTHDGTKVFDGTSPTTWTDLDLSSYVGAEHKLVLLKVKATSANTSAFRPDGDTDEYYSVNSYSGCNRAWTTAAVFGMAIVETGSNGIVEWRTFAAEAFEIWLLGYM